MGNYSDLSMAEKWVSIAVDENEDREFMNFMYSDGKNLMATNGHRVHVIPTQKPKGFYLRDGGYVDADDDLTFPSIEKFFATTVEPVKTEIPSPGLIDLSHHTLVKVDHVAFNLKYLIEAANSFTEITIDVTGPETASIGVNEFGTFCVMPIKE